MRTRKKREKQTGGRARGRGRRRAGVGGACARKVAKEEIKGDEDTEWGM